MIDNKIEKLGIIVKKAGKEQSLIQAQLAVTTGVGACFIRELEQGKKSCHVGNALHVVSMLEIDITISSKML